VESVGFLASGNNKTKAQFMERRGSYSTHAKRNGVSLLYDFELPDDQLQTDLEKLATLRKTYMELCVNTYFYRFFIKAMQEHLSKEQIRRIHETARLKMLEARNAT
jgi:hypothetical protein